MLIIEIFEPETKQNEKRPPEFYDDNIYLYLIVMNITSMLAKILVSIITICYRSNFLCLEKRIKNEFSESLLAGNPITCAVCCNLDKSMITFSDGKSRTYCSCSTENDTNSDSNARMSKYNSSNKIKNIEIITNRNPVNIVPSIDNSPEQTYENLNDKFETPKKVKTTVI
jgi:hypothetical protein